MADNFFKKIFMPKGKGKLWWVFVFIMVLAFSSFLVDFGSYYNQAVDKYGLGLPKVTERPYRLGLDLQGGTQLIYRADVSNFATSDRGSAVEGARDVIERRVNQFGVSEPLVQVNRSSAGDYRILVELAGIKDVNEAIRKIGETPLLEFKEPADAPVELTDEQRNEMEIYNAEAEGRAYDILGRVQNNGDFAAIAKEFSEDEESAPDGGNIGWRTERELGAIAATVESLEPGEVSDVYETQQGFEIVKLEDERQATNDDGEPAMEIRASHILFCFEGTENCDSGLSKEEALAKANEIREQATPENFSDLAKENSTEPAAATTGGDLGWQNYSTLVPDFWEAAKSQAVGTISAPVESQFGYHIIYKQEERPFIEYNVSHIFIDKQTESDILGPQGDWKNTELTGKYLKRATVTFNPNDNAPQVSLEFDGEGADLFAEITERNVGQPVAIFLDGLPISTPRVNERITGGQAVITGQFSLQEAKDLAKRLNAGALPVPIELINQQTVGASLGHRSVDDSLRAGLLGLLLVALFLIVVYRLPGLLAVASLAVYGLLILAIFKLWPVTLTLSGLAGFILSIGMAVDANVLIFERIKEELKDGRSFSMAIKYGFERAWTSIRDGNFTTLIVTVVLMIFSTSIIKGFAITLFLGILVSMFTAIVVTRNFLRLINERWFEKHSWLVGRLKK